MSYSIAYVQWYWVGEDHVRSTFYFLKIKIYIQLRTVTVLYSIPYSVYNT